MKIEVKTCKWKDNHFDHSEGFEVLKKIKGISFGQTLKVNKNCIESIYNSYLGNVEMLIFKFESEEDLKEYMTNDDLNLQGILEEYDIM